MATINRYDSLDGQRVVFMGTTGGIGEQIAGQLVQGGRDCVRGRL